MRQLENKMLKACVFWMNNVNSRTHVNMKIARNDCPVKIGGCGWCGLPLNVSEMISEKARSCSSEGRAVWFLLLASLQCPEIAMISWPWWTSAWLQSLWHRLFNFWQFEKSCYFSYIFHHSVLFCFWTRNFVYYASVSCAKIILPYVSLQYNWAWKPSKLGLTLSSSL